MAQVNITINGQNYTVTCDDGQEERLTDLAVFFDQYVQGIAQSVKGISDSRLMLLAGLTICDELKDTQMRLAHMEENSGLTSEEGAAQVLESAANKVRQVTQRLEESGSTS